MLHAAASCGENVYDMFLLELKSRTNPLPVRSTKGNRCLCINMKDCSTDFVIAAEKYLEDNPRYFKVHIKGDIYYVELVSAKGPREALI